MKTVSLLALSLFLTFSTAQAGELDPQVAPPEIIVRVDAQGNRDVFKVAVKSDVKDDQAAAEAIENFVTEKNHVETVVAESELDKVTSVDSWYYYYNPYFMYGYGYGYNYYGYNYYYRPYYYFSYGYYNYYYYRYY